jgi:hypothetical protein
MGVLVWIVGGVFLVDLAVVVGYLLREIVDRRRERREIEDLNALWQAPTAPPVRPLRPSEDRPRVRGSGVVTLLPIVRPALAGRLRGGRMSLGALLLALTALIGVLAVGSDRPLLRGAATREGAAVPTWTSKLERPYAGTSDRAAEDPGPNAATGDDAPSLASNDPVVTALPDDAPAPEAVAADPRSSDEIVLAWRRVEDASGYLVERWDAPSDALPGWVLIGRTEADSTSYVDTGLDPSTTYYYRISAATHDGTAPSDVVSATTLPGPPDAPVVTATAGQAAIELRWTDVGGETGYRIERAADPAGAWAVIGTVGQDVTIFVDGGLGDSATYSYRVVATSAAGDSAPSGIVTATSSDPAAAGGADDGAGAGSTDGGQSGGSASSPSTIEEQDPTVDGSLEGSLGDGAAEPPSQDPP